MTVSDAKLRPARLYVMQLVDTTIPGPTGELRMSMGCYLVEMSDSRRVLIDTGLPPMEGTPQAMPRPRIETNVIEQLAGLGLQPEDIDILICTHFDVDHAGYNDAFPSADLIVQRRHYELARGGHARFAAARTHWDHPSLRYRLLDGDTELLPGLRLIETSGHAPAHQSVLVRLPMTGPVLLAIDAVAMRRGFRPDRTASPVDDNEQELRASTEKLLDLVEKERVALVVFGHDGEQWATLKRAPEYYE